MNKLIATVALALSISSTGCFTAAGGLIGSQVKSEEVIRNPDGSHDYRESNNLVTGLVIGAVVDAIVLSAAAAAGPSNCFTYGPGEGRGGC